MKKDLTGRQSSNVEVRQREFPRPTNGTRIGGDTYHRQDQKAYDSWGKQRIKATLQDKDSPFRDTLKSMDTVTKQINKDQANARASGQNAHVPIPTPRPDPNAPVTQPTVFNSDNGKG